MFRKFIIPLLILCLAGGGAFALFKTRPKSEPIEAEENRWLVSTMEAQPGSHTPELTLYGVVESPMATQLRAAIQADVLAVHVREGEPVERGQALLELDTRDLELIIRQREAEIAQIDADMQAEQVRHDTDKASLPVDKELLRLSRKAAERAKDLVTKKVGPRSTLDTALQDVQRQLLSVKSREQSIRQFESNMSRLRASQTRAQALLEQARLDLERSRVTSPYTGRVAAVNVALGDRVRVGDSLLELYDNNALQVRAQIANRHVSSVRDALRQSPLEASARVDGRPVQLLLKRFAGRAGDGGGVFGLFDVLEGGGSLPLGRFITLRMRLPAVNNVIAIPVEALYG
ncbi:MAG: efflux RND transporter periplasmic adaptor subunit, partial [Gammaproteobacteria bacterium]